MSVLEVPDVIVELVTTLERAGYETWCVGGAVRDALLGYPHLDWDLATAARPEQVQRLFRRTIPIGIRFGTVGVLDRHGRMHEVTTFRRDTETDGRHAVVEFGASLDDDLARRDLTINAIAYSPTRGVLHDPFGGRADLELRVVRAVGDPAERMREDRLRALRAIRFAARLDFRIDEATWTAIRESARFLGRLSRERVREELEKTMEQVAQPSTALGRWKGSGALEVLIPALATISASSLRAIDFLAPPGPIRRPQRATNRIAALFLEVPIRDVAPALRDLRFSNGDIAWMTELVRRWQELGDAIGTDLVKGADMTPARIRTWASGIGRMRISAFFRLAAAVWHARRERGVAAPAPIVVGRIYRRIARSAWRDALDVADLSVDGEDLIRAGVPAGPRIGIVLRKLLLLVLEDPAHNTREKLLSAALTIDGTRA